MSWIYLIKKALEVCMHYEKNWGGRVLDEAVTYDNMFLLILSTIP
jgi:hypothetical protein